MRTKDQILLENAYAKILNKEAFEEIEVQEIEAPFTRDHLEDREEESMAKTNLYAICKHAKELLDMVEHGASLDPWQLEKLAIVADNIASVHQYEDYQNNTEEAVIDTHADLKEAKNNEYAICRASIAKDGHIPSSKKDELKRCEKKVGAKIKAKKRKTK